MTELQKATRAFLNNWFSTEPRVRGVSTGVYIENMRKALEAEQAQATYITPLMEQQMFDDWCPYKGNPDPRCVWAAAIDAVNDLTLCAEQISAPTWQAERINEHEIRVTSPEGESLRLRSADRNDSFNNFIWRWAESIANKGTT